MSSDSMTDQQGSAYSIIIPAYNEGARVGATLEKVLAYVAGQGWDAEVIAVNDGSGDNTAGIIRGYAEKNPRLRLLENPGNRGKGYSVRNGMLHAHGDISLFSDADLSSPIEEVGKLFSALAGGADIAIGSRWLCSDLQTRRQPLYRQLFGRIFNLLLRIMLGLDFRDTHAASKRSPVGRRQQFSPCRRLNGGALIRNCSIWPGNSGSRSWKPRWRGPIAKAPASVRCGMEPRCFWKC